jgi:hypothetical protein
LIPWLDLIDSLNEVIRSKAIRVDRQHVQKEVGKIVDIAICLVLLHSVEQRDDDLAEIRLKGITAVPVHLATTVTAQIRELQITHRGT